MSRKYRDAAAKLQQNVQRHLKEMKEVSSSDDEDPFESSVLEGVFRSYSYQSRGGESKLLSRTRHLLEEAISGRSVTCLICIGSIKRTDALWSCGHCYSYFHLSCIQEWGRDCVSVKSADVQSPIAVHVPKKVDWCCPKCRQAYSKDQIPRKYRCFCGKTDDPPIHPWLIPHSCGEACGKRLSTGGHCRHTCLLLCHPGPCPPCPQFVNEYCHCGKESKLVRCSQSSWCCDNKCQKLLFCSSHKCHKVCHEGACPPCSYTSVQACQCGAQRVKRPCNDPTWQCEKPCNKPFDCGYHKCDKVCHSGSCGSCPNSGMKLCPCGATQKVVQCPDFMETCLGTCNKKHEYCIHNCPEKCHKGPCPPCQVLIQKKCLCGAHERSLPCSKEFKCETKCRGIRPCGKHTCARKCCSGNCPSCEKTCDKPLQCGRHKCSMICHRGPCYPCPRESKVTCRCKSTFITVPCGRDKNVKPPKCSLPCKIKYKCGHLEENKHTCHFGDCPPCKAICDKTYPKCDHKCKAKCHEYVAVVFHQVEKPATPWEVQPPKTKIMALECPPCPAPVQVVCFGEHDTETQPCHSARRRACGRECGKPLPCGNHNCTLLCHLYEPNEEYLNVPYVCKPCNQECIVPRPENCTHKCAIRACHPGPCPPCEVMEKIKCYCGLTELYYRCKDLTNAPEQMLSCQQQCPKYLECGHRCKRPCHLDFCGAGDQVCTKKSKVCCPCGSNKKEIPCDIIKALKVKLECNQNCEEKKIAAELERKREQLRLDLLEEEKNRKELEEFKWKLCGKKKKYKKRVSFREEKPTFINKYKVPIIAVLVALVAVGMGFCFVGIMTYIHFYW